MDLSPSPPISVEAMENGVVSGTRALPLDTLHERAAQAAQGFQALGVTEGDSLALLLRNDFAFLEASLAAARLGAYAVPINWHNAAEEVAYILEDSGAKVLVAHADLLAATREKLPGRAFPAGLGVLGVPTPPEIEAAYGLAPHMCALPEGVTAWERWLAGHPPLLTPPPPSRASMIYTSGTTGRPKGVRRRPFDEDGLQRRDRLLAEVWGIRPGIRACITGPMYHSAPNGYGLIGAQQAEHIVLQPRFDAEELLRLIEEHRLTHMHIVPTMFVRLLRLPEQVRQRYDLSSLEWVIHGAAPCADSVKRAMIDWWGPVIHEYYGSTETGLNFHSTSEQWLRKPGSVGMAAYGTELRILDEDDAELPVGAVGQIYLRAAATPDFTYHRLDAKRRQIERDGFVTVGDMGRIDDEGFLYILDRRIDMVISGGVNIYPAEIEAVLIAMPGVKDCAVFGIPDEEYGEKLACVVQLERPAAGGVAPDMAQIRAFLAEHLAEFKIPRHFEFHEDLPREDSGKIFKRKLREPFWRDSGRSI